MLTQTTGGNGMAEMAGGVLESQHDAVREASATGHDASGAVAAEMGAEGRWTPTDAAAVSEGLAPGLAALEAETED